MSGKPTDISDGFAEDAFEKLGTVLDRSVRQASYLPGTVLDRAVRPGSQPGAGLHKGVPYDTYATWQAANHSMLEHFCRTPAHARHYLVSGGKDTKAKARGSAVHVAVLEPERFAREFVAAPKLDKRTRAGKAEWGEFEAANADKVVLTDAEMDLAQKLQAAVWSHKTASEILSSPGFNEASLLWVDPQTGLDCKSRLDAVRSYAGWSVIADLKTARDASRKGFEKAVLEYGYHRQAAQYLDGAQAVAPREAERKWLWIVAETEPPYLCAVYEIEDAALSIGRDEWHKHLRTYAECTSSGIFPGYPEGIDYCGLPSWAYRSIEGD